MNGTSQTTASSPEPASQKDDLESRRPRLKQVIDHAAHLLPAQGPIPVFIHHNTLHAFEELPFTEAVEKGAQVFGCQPYLSEDRFRAELARGRIRFSELQSILEEQLGGRAGERIGTLTTRAELRLAMLQYPLRSGPAAELSWFIAETDALRRIRPEVSAAVRGRLIAETRRWAMRDLRWTGVVRPNSRLLARDDRPATGDLGGIFEQFGRMRIEVWSEANWEEFTLHILWRICCDGAAAAAPAATHTTQPIRHRDLLLAATGADADLPVHDLLIRFCAAFVDQGLAHWQMPARDLGFWSAFCSLYRQIGGPPDRERNGLAEEIRRLERLNFTPLDSILESLELLGVPEEEWEPFIAQTLLALRGWSGIIRFLEERGDRSVHPAPAGSLVEFLAVRLVLDRLTLAHLARSRLGLAEPLSRLRPHIRQTLSPHQPPGIEQRAFVLFQLAQVLGWTPEELRRLRPADWAALFAEAEEFTGVARRRTFHLAYERRFYTQTLDGIALHARKPTPTPQHPQFQAICCIDEREESLRRNLEELAPDAVTYGVAGFFVVAMYYKGAADAHYTPLCPAVFRPKHWVVEDVEESAVESHRRRAWTRRALGLATHQFHIGSRSFFAGVVASAVGMLAAIPLVARTDSRGSLPAHGAGSAGSSSLPRRRASGSNEPSRIRGRVVVASASH